MDDLRWLKELNAKLWPDEQCEKGRVTTPHGPVQIKAEAKRRLKKKEWKRIRKAIIEGKLPVEMVSTSMFGGVGICIYRHPCQPGLDHEVVILITQDHLPGKREPGPSMGNCSRDAWKKFSKITHTDENKIRLKRYGLREPREASSYDY
jgi:hypothetical protein